MAPVRSSTQRRPSSGHFAGRTSAVVSAVVFLLLVLMLLAFLFGPMLGGR
jgi:hypothetical protein